jgi:hypothetical protein
MFRLFLSVAVAAACLIAVSSQASAQEAGYSPLFSQYTTQGAGAPSAGMYPAPHPVPNMGAQSLYTYQPLMPHEMMYQHSRNYYNYYDAGFRGGDQGLVKTSVRWQAGNSHMGPLPFSTGLGGLSYKINKRKYCLDGNCGGGSGLGRGRRVRGGGGCATGECQ